MGRTGWENCVGGRGARGIYGAKMLEGCERGRRVTGGQKRPWGVYRGRGV